MKRIQLFIPALLLSLSSLAQIPGGFYSSSDRIEDEEMREKHGKDGIEFNDLWSDAGASMDILPWNGRRLFFLDFDQTETKESRIIFFELNHKEKLLLSDLIRRFGLQYEFRTRGMNEDPAMRSQAVPSL